MTYLAHYAGIAKPEEKTTIKVIADSLQIIHGAYQQWKLFTKDFEVDDVFYNASKTDALYDSAVEILGKVKVSFRSVDLEEILNKIPFEDKASGLFLSALHNTTDIETLDGIFKYHITGYRLAEGKNIICREGSKIEYLARYAVGGYIENHGTVDWMADCASGGMQVNHGTVDWMASFSSGGVQVNNGTVHFMAYSSSGGMSVNHGTVEWMALSASGGMQVNFGKAINNYCKPLPKEILKRLRRKTLTLKNLTPEQLQTFDWKTFEEEMKEMLP